MTVGWIKLHVIDGWRCEHAATFVAHPRLHMFPAMIQIEAN